MELVLEVAVPGLQEVVPAAISQRAPVPEVAELWSVVAERGLKRPAVPAAMAKLLAERAPVFAVEDLWSAVV